MLHSANIANDKTGLLCRTPECDATPGLHADTCDECSVEELRVQHKMMREALEGIAAHLVTESAEAPVSALPADVRQQLDVLIEAGIVALPSVPAHPYDDSSLSGVYEVFEDPEPTGVIMADLEYLARRLDGRA